MEVVTVRQKAEEPDEYERLEQYEGMADLFQAAEAEEEEDDDDEEE